MESYNNEFDRRPDETAAPSIRVVKVTRIWPIILAAVLATVATASLCFFVFLAGRINGTAVPEGTPAWESKLTQIHDLVDQYFIGELDEDKLADAAASGMIEGLDDEWSYYITAADYSSYLETVSNSYVGIGVTITVEDIKQGLMITDVTPDSPAYAAGLEIGDLVLAVEGVPIMDGSENALDLAETKNRVRGQEGTDVTLTVSHNGVERDVTITRAKIKTINVSWEMLEGQLALIRIRNFEQDASKDTIAAIKEARAQGAVGLIFDVRYNPGGYKHELVKILDFLLPEGPLFRSVDYNGKESVEYSDASYLDMPMVVLCNYESYSAAEFFPAALQEYHAATIIGEQTYGKGRFQTAMKLDDGSAINISIGQYTTPNGVSLVGKGITPDILVELSDAQKRDLYYNRLDKAEDAQLQKAIEVLKAQ